MVKFGTLATSALAASCLLTCGYASAAPLGSSSPIPAPAGPVLQYVVPTLTLVPSGDPCGTSTSFSGSWASPAAQPWINSPFTATGPYPCSATGTSTSTWTFAQGLPAGTFFLFSDVDAGSGPNENFVLTASLGGNQIVTEWLSEPVNIPGFTPSSSDLPSSNFSGGVYTFDGSTVPGNPTELFALLSITQIDELTVVKSDTNFGFGLAAPVSEPATLALLGVGLFGFAGWRQRSSTGRVSGG